MGSLKRTESCGKTEGGWRKVLKAADTHTHTHMKKVLNGHMYFSTLLSETIRIWRLNTWVSGTDSPVIVFMKFHELISFPFSHLLCRHTASFMQLIY